MPKEVKLLMDDERNLYIQDSEGVSYLFWPLGYGLPVDFVIETFTERKRKIENEKQREANKRFESAKADFERSKKPWWAIF